MFDPLARLLPPPSLWDNPLFRTDARAIRFGCSWAVLRRRLFRWGIQMLILLTVCFALALLNQLLWLNINGYNYAYWRTTFSGNFLAFALAGAVALNLILDFAGVSAALNTISSDFTDRRADLIRLTLTRPTQIVAAKHELARVRVFRMTARIMWLRLWVVVMGISLGLGLYLESAPRSAPVAPEIVIAAAIIIVLSSATYIVEPFWRAKAITAAGIAVSARTRNGVSATLNAGFTLIAFWIGQGLVIVLLAFLGQITVLFYVSDPSVTVGMFLVFWGGVTAAIYVFYAGVTRSSLYQAAYRLATLDN